MRAVTSATAAAVLGIERKVLDNLLLRLGDDFLPAGRQGRERRIPVTALAELLLVVDLVAVLHVPARRALELVRRSAEAGERGPFVGVRLEHAAAQDEVESRLSVAIESVARPPRGRPRRNRNA